jgi:hypothetical protein
MQILKDGESIQEMGPLFTPDTGAHRDAYGSHP